MTLTERRYYIIAIGLSILFHVVLLLFTFPEKLGFGRGSNDQMETISAGLIDFNPEAQDSNPGSDTAAQPANVVVEETVAKAESERPQPVVQVKPPQAEPKVKPVDKSAIETGAKVPKPKTEPKVEQPKIEPKHTPKQENAKPHNVGAEIASAGHEPKDPNASPAKVAEVKETGSGGGVGSGTDSGNGGKGGNAPQSLGYGGSMVASGLDVQLFYPKNALNENKEGDVKLRVLIDRDGSLEKIESLQLSGDTRLDNAAVGCVKRYIKFKSYKDKYYIDLMVIFKLANGTPVIKFLNAETRP